MYRNQLKPVTMKRNGFTLVELLIGMAVAAVMISVAAPMLGDYNQNNKLRSAANEFAGMVQLARSEAIKRNTIVNLVTVNTGDDADNWSDRIDMCTAIDNAKDCTHASATFIRQFTIGTDAVTIKGSQRATSIISFDAQGRLNENRLTAELSFCDLRPVAEARAKKLQINVTGRPRISDLDPDGGDLCDPA